MNKSLILSRIALIAYIGLITTLSLTPAQQLPDIQFWDKAEHAIAYALMVTLATISFPRHALIASLLCLAYSAGIEFAQGFIPGRHPSGLDIVANGVGIFIGVIITRCYQAFKAR